MAKTNPVEAADIARIRKTLGMTQQHFGSIFGFSPTTISRWEQNHTQLTDGSRITIGLLVRAMKKRALSTVLPQLPKLVGLDDVERTIALVRLGD